MSELNFQNVSGENHFYHKYNLRGSNRRSKLTPETERLEKLAGKVIAEAMTEAAVRRCWGCGKLFVKEGGCNMVTCVCGGVNCWNCGFGGPLNQSQSHSCFFIIRLKERNTKADIKRAARCAKKNLLKKHPFLKFIYDPSRSFKFQCSRKLEFKVYGLILKRNVSRRANILHPALNDRASWYPFYFLVTWFLFGVRMILAGLLLLSLGISTCDAARILALVPFNSRSHFIVMEPLFKALAARGHNVTVFSSFPQKTPLPNYTDVDFSPTLPPTINLFSLNLIKEHMPNPWATTHFIHSVHRNSCTILEDFRLQSLVKSKGSFDLLITEVFGDDCFTYFAYKLGIPLVSFTTSKPVPWAAERVGLPDNPSYIPTYLTDSSPNQNFAKRLYNTALLLYAKFWHQWIYYKQTQDIVERSFRESLPPVHEVVANTSLLLVNSHFTLSQSRPLPPNVGEVGGIHIQPRRTLSEEYKEIFDKSKNGVIIMSFGSLVRSSSLPKPIIGAFMSVFSKISQTVVFKYEEELPDVPPNVLVRKWIPQRDMIEHDKVVAVIQHGGLASTLEAVYCGKPLLGIPFFADQYINLRNLVEHNAALQLDLASLSEETLAAAVVEITTNPKYREGMQLLSRQFRDRPVSPLDTAVFWTEYVVRHQGTPHLRAASVHLPLHQYLLLDVLVSAIVCLYVVYNAGRASLLLFFCKKRSVSNVIEPCSSSLAGTRHVRHKRKSKFDGKYT